MLASGFEYRERANSRESKKKKNTVDGNMRCRQSARHL